VTIWPNALNVGDAWQCARVPPTPLWHSQDIHLATNWMPAAVPGNLEADLIRLGLMDDPCTSQRRDIGARWVEDWDWWYRTTVRQRLTDGQRARLVLHGVDYYSAVVANESLLGHQEGMFGRHVYDVTDLLRRADGRLDLAIRLWGAHALPQRRLSLWQRLAEPLLRRVAATDMFPARTRTLKCQMSFGWDFAPRLPTIGIWDDVELVTSGPVFIDNLWVCAEPRGDGARLRVRLRLDSTISGRAAARLSVRGGEIAADPCRLSDRIALAGGAQNVELAFVLPRARLWQPWDRGEPCLYDLTLEIEPEGAHPPSVARTTFGVRSVAFQPTPAPKRGEAWMLVVNGQPEFVRGVNWVPADVLPGRVGAADYEALIGMAKAANANILRVWGGGLREKRAFYDICDRLGMLVWQEFPLACPNLLRYPTDERFMTLVEREATSIVEDLRNHASVAIWCGGNEFGSSKNQKPVGILSDVVQRGDGTRPWLAASPSSGDRHNWTVWHHGAPVSAYVKEQATFVSEFGLQSAPDVESMRSFLPPGSLWPPDAAWAFHSAEVAKLQRYAAPHLRPGAAPAVEGFVQATQAAQAWGVQVMVEHMRRRKPETGGVMIWQLNEPWPAICWSLISHNQQPKLAYHTLQRVFAPLLVSVRYPFKRYQPGETVQAEVWVVNDLLSVLDDSACALTLTLNGREVDKRNVFLTPNSSTIVGRVSLSLPDTQPWLLRAELRQGGSVVAENEYDLGYIDDRRVSLLHRVLSLFGRWLLR
jgi:beta-mannosidase